MKDMRHQELMPDVLHWLGIKKIDNVSCVLSGEAVLKRVLTWFVRRSGFPSAKMISMSDMKYNAIVGSGITINRRYESKHTSLLGFPSSRIDRKI